MYYELTFKNGTGADERLVVVEADAEGQLAELAQKRLPAQLFQKWDQGGRQFRQVRRRRRGQMMTNGVYCPPRWAREDKGNGRD